MAKKKDKIWKNPLGHYTIEEFMVLIYQGKLDDYMRFGRLSVHKCPPLELMDVKQTCFYCVQCKKSCSERVKQNKKFFKALKTKMTKDDMDVFIRDLSIETGLCEDAVLFDKKAEARPVRYKNKRRR